MGGVGETTSMTSTTKDGQKVMINNGLISTRLSRQATSMMKMANAYWNSLKCTGLTTILMMSLMVLTKNLTTLATSLTKNPITILTMTPTTSLITVLTTSPITAPMTSPTTALTMGLITTPTTSPITGLTTIPTTKMVTSMS